MSLEGWRLSRVELRDLLNKYEKAVEDDAFGLLRPSELERQMLGEKVMNERRSRVVKARDANRRFIEAVVEDLPDLCSGMFDDPNRPMVKFSPLQENIPTLPSNSYGSLASVFLHIFRDWSSECDHVHNSTYGPAIAELKRLLPTGGDVLVPGAGLARLAMSIAADGYKVEANEASRLFLTFADYVLNRAPDAGNTVFPMAHVFSENFGHEQQYLEIKAPSPRPREVVAKMLESGNPILTMVPGDFVKLYREGGPSHRKFDAVVTCFFIDTVADICELVQVIDGLLNEGGAWINIGPLNWRKEARMKLNWNEVVQLWENLGFKFVTQSRSDCDYHMRHGQKMYTESYSCALVAAVKGQRCEK